MRFLVFLAVALSALGMSATAAPPDDPAGRALLAAAQRAITAYHEGNAVPAPHVLRVVYFHPNDRAPLRDYAARLDRVMNDISDFYRDGLRRFGIENRGLPLERKEGRVVLHVVRGKLPASAYGHESGDEAEAEIRAALHDVIDFDREHVLVLYGLCRQEPDGRYILDAPYYGKGGSSQVWGLCHAADCELLDSRLLTETKQSIVHPQDDHERMRQSFAEFNSWYIGGVAHELGHALGLDHDAGNPAEKRFGTSLMGSGNRMYRHEVWGGKAPAFLSRVSALQLLSHPLFTGLDHGRWDDVGRGLDDLSFALNGTALRLAGRAGGEVPPYAVVAYAWPVDGDEHYAQTYPVVLDRTGAFAIDITALPRKATFLRVATLHVNGGTTSQQFRMELNRAGMPDIAALNADWIVERAERAVLDSRPEIERYVSDAALERAPTAEARRKLQVLREVIKPTAHTDLATVTGATAFVSDAQWTSANVGWGQPAQNHYWFDDKIRNGVFFVLGGQFFAKGLYAHSSSRYAFDLGGKWKKFSATVGLRDGAHEQGSAVFTVRGDGRELYRSPMLRVNARRDFTIDVTGVKELELLADGGEGHIHNSWAIWAEPLLRR